MKYFKMKKAAMGWPFLFQVVSIEAQGSVG